MALTGPDHRYVAVDDGRLIEMTHMRHTPERSYPCGVDKNVPVLQEPPSNALRLIVMATGGFE